MAKEWTVDWITPGEWDKLVQRSPQRNLYCDARVHAVAAGSVGADVRYLGIHSGRALVGGLTCYVKDGMLEHPRIIQYGGFVLSEELQPNQVRLAANLRHAVDAMAPFCQKNWKQGYFAVPPELPDIRAFLWCGFSVVPRYTYRISLSDMESVHESFTKEARYDIRKAEEAGLKVEPSRNLDEFLKLFDETMQRQGVQPQYATSVLRDLDQALGDQSRLYIVGNSASALVLRDDRRAYYAFGASGDGKGGGAPTFLQWRIMQDLAAEGVMEYDLSGANTPSIVSFKEQFGGDLVVYYGVSWGEAPAAGLLRRFMGKILGKGRSRTVSAV